MVQDLCNLKDCHWLKKEEDQERRPLPRDLGSDLSKFGWVIAGRKIIRRRIISGEDREKLNFKYKKQSKWKKIEKK